RNDYFGYHLDRTWRLLWLERLQARKRNRFTVCIPAWPWCKIGSPNCRKKPGDRWSNGSSWSKNRDRRMRKSAANGSRKNTTWGRTALGGSPSERRAKAWKMATPKPTRGQRRNMLRTNMLGRR